MKQKTLSVMGQFAFTCKTPKNILNWNEGLIGQKHGNKTNCFDTSPDDQTVLPLQY
jgi:hypothetical protein